MAPDNTTDHLCMPILGPGLRPACACLVCLPGSCVRATLAHCPGALPHARALSACAAACPSRTSVGRPPGPRGVAETAERTRTGWSSAQWKEAPDCLPASWAQGQRYNTPPSRRRQPLSQSGARQRSEGRDGLREGDDQRTEVGVGWVFPSAHAPPSHGRRFIHMDFAHRCLSAGQPRQAVSRDDNGGGQGQAEAQRSGLVLMLRLMLMLRLSPRLGLQRNASECVSEQPRERSIQHSMGAAAQHSASHTPCLLFALAQPQPRPPPLKTQVAQGRAFKSSPAPTRPRTRLGTRDLRAGGRAGRRADGPSSICLLQRRLASTDDHTTFHLPRSHGNSLFTRTPTPDD